MNVEEVMTALASFGNEQTKKTYLNHGAHEPLFGVKVGDLKKIQKKIKKNHNLSLELYATGNSDAMYLASLIADEKQINNIHLQQWAEQAYWYYLSEFAVAWIAAESSYGWELAMEWIKSPKENIASSGWATLSNLLIIKNDSELDVSKLTELLAHVEENIHKAQNRVRYVMNGFVIALGSSVIPLSEGAQKAAKTIGKVEVNVGSTSCKVPLASEYIQKTIANGKLGYKKKQARC